METVAVLVAEFDLLSLDIRIDLGVPLTGVGTLARVDSG
jgi:hypothetical protein